MQRAVRGLGIFLVVGAIGGCGSGGVVKSGRLTKPVEGYVCCNMWFNGRGQASDANYRILGGKRIQAGTPVKAAIQDFSLVFHSPERERFSVRLRHGKERLTLAEYARLLIVPADPTASISPGLREALRSGKLAIGMTKEEAVMVRGYPPFHRTAGLESNEWLYYESPGSTQLVRFTDGRITEIEAGAAP